jgi:hypothetical protein
MAASLESLSAEDTAGYIYPLRNVLTEDTTATGYTYMCALCPWRQVSNLMRMQVTPLSVPSGGYYVQRFPWRSVWLPRCCCCFPPSGKVLFEFAFLCKQALHARHGLHAASAISQWTCGWFRYASRLGMSARLAQLAERKTLNLVVVGSSPTVGIIF